MEIQKNVIYRVYKFSNIQKPYTLFIWDMIDFENRNVLENIAHVFPDPPILQSAITGRFDDQDEIIYEFETLEELNEFEEDLNIYKLRLDLGDVEVCIDNEDQFTLSFEDIEFLPSLIEFTKDQLGIPEIEKYLTCIDQPNIYHCFDYYGTFVEHRNSLGDLITG